MAVVTGTPEEISSERMQRAVPIVALDYPDATKALELVSLLGDRCRFYKVGSELFATAGPSVVERIRSAGCDVFLDLKLHDIPNTVERAMRSIAAMRVRLATVHASGGRAMLEAAVDAAGADCGVLAVTVLTSLNGPALSEILGGTDIEVDDVVLRLAALAASSGVAGVVSSGNEARLVRTRFGGTLEILVPGIRLPGDSAGDQSRVVTPEAAVAAGADYLVIGRSVTAAPDPRQAMDLVIERIGG